MFPLFYCENLFITEIIIHFIVHHKQLDQMIFLVIRIISSLKLGISTVVYKSFHHSSWEIQHFPSFKLLIWGQTTEETHWITEPVRVQSGQELSFSVHHKPELRFSSSVRFVCTLKTGANTWASKPPHNLQINK